METTAIETKIAKNAHSATHFPLIIRRIWEIGIANLVSCPVNTRTKLGDLLENGVGRRGPDERPTRTIVVLDEGVDFPYEILDAGERTPANGALGDEAEPAHGVRRCGGWWRRLSLPLRKCISRSGELGQLMHSDWVRCLSLEPCAGCVGTKCGNSGAGNMLAVTSIASQ